MSDSSNIVPIRPAPPSESPPSKQRKVHKLRHHQLVDLALQEHQSRIHAALAVLDLLDAETSQKSCTALTWKQWCTICAAIDATRQLLAPIQELTDADSLAKTANATLAAER
jgi:hypothetical protein